MPKPLSSFIFIALIGEANCSSLWQQPELLKLKEQMTRIKSKLKSTQKEFDKKREEKKKHAVKVEKLKKDLMVATQKLKEVEENGPDVGGKIQLSESQLQEYYRV